MAAKKPRRETRKSWRTKPAVPRRGVSGSVALAILNQAPRTTRQDAAGAMRPGGIDVFDPTPPTTVRPAPATGVGDPDRAPPTRHRSRTTSRVARTARTASGTRRRRGR